MEQGALFEETLTDAVGSAIKASGGYKEVAHKLWPAMKSDSAYARLKDCLDPDGRQKLSLDEFMHILRLASARADRSVPDFLARELGFEIKTLSPVEAKKRKKKARMAALMDELRRLAEEE